MVPDTHGPEDQPVWYMANLDVCMALHFSRRKIRPNSLICPNPSYHLGWKVGHGGSHGYLTDEFVTALLENRSPLINIAWSLNMTVPGIIAHQSALNDGELLKVPQYTWPI